jgi:D-arabinose 1-dehydrogenase-like Zn-dependent alcohol dehydrogenase
VGGSVSGVAGATAWSVNPNLHCGHCEYCQKGQHSLCVSYGILGEHTHGGLAEYVKADGRKVLKLPEAVRFEDAAAFILVNMTAWRMLVSQARLRAGEDLLIIAWAAACPPPGCRSASSAVRGCG